MLLSVLKLTIDCEKSQGGIGTNFPNGPCQPGKNAAAAASHRRRLRASREAESAFDPCEKIGHMVKMNERALDLSLCWGRMRRESQYPEEIPGPVKSILMICIAVPALLVTIGIQSLIEKAREFVRSFYCEARRPPDFKQ